MANAVDDDFRTFQFEKDPVVAYPQSVFRGEVGQPFYITGQVPGHCFDSIKHSCLLVPRQRFQVFYGFRLDLDFVLDPPSSKEIIVPKFPNSQKR